MLNEFYTDSKIKCREPRGSLLILDRSFDLLGPVCHDYYYQSNVADFKDGLGDDGKFKLDHNKVVYLND